MPLVDVLQFIKLSGRNGVLLLDSQGSRAEIGFFRGNVVRAHCPSSKPLGGHLVESGCLSDEELQRALEIQQAEEPPPPIGALLLRLGLVRRNELVEAFRQQMLQTIYELLSWRGGGFRFTQDAQKPFDDLFLSPSELAEVSLDTEQVLLEGAQMLDEHERTAKPVATSEAVDVRPPTTESSSDAAQTQPRCEGPSQPQRRSPRSISGMQPSTKLYLWALSRDSSLLTSLGETLADDDVVVVALRSAEATSQRATPRRRAFLVDLRGAGELGMRQLAAVRDAHPGAHVLAVTERGAKQAATFGAGATSVLEPDVESIAAWVRSMKKQELHASSRAIFAEGLATGFAKLRKLIGEVRCGVISATPTLSLLNLVSDTVERGVFFAIDRGHLVGLGGFGATGEHRQVAEQTRGLKIPLDFAGVLGDCVRDVQARSADVDCAELPSSLMDRIGLPKSRSFGVFPVLGAGCVRALLYVDNGERNWPVEELEFLELAAAQMGLALENEQLRRGLFARSPPTAPLLDLAAKSR